MRKKHFALLLVIVLLFSLTACAKDTTTESTDVTDPAVTEEATDEAADEAVEPEVTEPEVALDTGASIAGQPVEKNDKGTGPVAIESRFGTINIPAGLDYQLYYVPTGELGKGKTDTIQVDFGKGNTNSGYIHISSTRMVASLDEALAESSRMNDFGTKDSVAGDEVTFNGVPFKHQTIQKPDGTDANNYLIGYYKTVDDTDGFVEVCANGKERAYSIDINDPLIVELMESLVLK